MHYLSLAGDLPATSINEQVAKKQRWRDVRVRPGLRGSARAAQHGLDASHKLAWAERLGYVVVCTHGQPNNLVYLFRTSGKHQHVCIGELTQLPAHLYSIQSRKHHVQDDQVGTL